MKVCRFRFVGLRRLSISRTEVFFYGLNLDRKHSVTRASENHILNVDCDCHKTLRLLVK